MSIFRKIGRALKKAAPIMAAVPGPIGAVGKIASGALGGGMAMHAGAGMFPALPTIGGAVVRSLPSVGGAVVRSLPGVGAAVGRVATGRIGRAVAGGAIGAAIYDAAGNLIGYRKKKRRINPLNHRALSRALRRVEAAKKTCSRVNRITIRKEKCRA